VYAITVTGSGQGTTDPVAQAAAGILASRSAALLVAERQRMILTTSDSKMLNLVSSPKVAKVPAVSPVGVGGTPAPTASTAPTAPTVPMGAPNPGTAEAIAYNMLPAFGFAKSQFGCLYQMWMRESGWRYNAANASGAYGIPQALPGSKMATAGADWLSNPATQIRWGLGYIKSTYGSPCGAWAFWQANGWY
jgi:hypothetical protein